MWPFKRKSPTQLKSPEHQPDAAASRLVVEMAKAFISAMQAASGSWQKAFYRLEVSDALHSSSGSFVTPSDVHVMDAFAFDTLFEKLEPLALELAESTKPKEKPFCILLLSINCDFDYTIDFEWVDQNRWRISKMDGGTGIPEGK